MNPSLKIDIVSDISCPWCIIGYRSLDAALRDLDLRDTSSLRWLPFELNPKMLPEGQDLKEHMQQKYGATAEQSSANRLKLKARGAEVGYDFNVADDGRIYNTFDAHRLLHWAALLGLQTELKLALFDLYFKQQGNPSNHQQLANCAGKIGLDAEIAKQILEADSYRDEVKSDLEFAHRNGINSVPCFIFNDKYLLSGAQPKAAFVEALQQLQSG